MKVERECFKLISKLFDLFTHIPRYCLLHLELDLIVIVDFLND